MFIKNKFKRLCDMWKGGQGQVCVQRSRPERPHRGVWDWQAGGGQVVGWGSAGPSCPGTGVLGVRGDEQIRLVEV